MDPDCSVVAICDESSLTATLYACPAGLGYDVEAGGCLPLDFVTW